MGSYTNGRYPLYRPNPSDFVDPKRDMQDNFDVIDGKIYPTLQWHIPSTSPLPLSGNLTGFKYFDPRTNLVYVWNGLQGRWAIFKNQNANNGWNNLTLATGYGSGGGDDIYGRASWRYTTPEADHVELKGKIYKFDGAIPNNVFTVVAAAGSLPIPGAGNTRYFHIPPGIGSSNPNNNSSCRLSVGFDGALNFIHYGTSVNGDINNYICLDGIYYGVA